jgi:hypothetical protein
MQQLSFENMSTRRPGFYVEGRPYGTRFAQACGRATFLAKEHKRSIDVMFVNHLGIEERELTVVQPREGLVGNTPRAVWDDGINRPLTATALLKRNAAWLGADL